jgi:hypothetical protein
MNLSQMSDSIEQVVGATVARMPRLGRGILEYSNGRGGLTLWKTSSRARHTVSMHAFMVNLLPVFGPRICDGDEKQSCSAART